MLCSEKSAVWPGSRADSSEAMVAKVQQVPKTALVAHGGQLVERAQIVGRRVGRVASWRAGSGRRA